MRAPPESWAGLLTCSARPLPPLTPHPTHTHTHAPPRPPRAGLGSGGKHVADCRKSFLSAVELLVELASLQTAFLTLDEAIKTTNRRVNALEHVVKPRLENTIAYIKVGSSTHPPTLPACLPACVPPSLPARLPACLAACQPASLHARPAAFSHPPLVSLSLLPYCAARASWMSWSAKSSSG